LKNKEERPVSASHFYNPNQNDESEEDDQQEEEEDHIDDDR